jgi:hypothetical protein
MSFSSSSVPDEGTYKGVYLTWSSNGNKVLKSANGWLTLSSVDFTDLVSGNAIPAGRKLTELFVSVESGNNIYFALGSEPTAVVNNAFVDGFYQGTVKVRTHSAYSFELSGLGITSINLHSIGNSHVRVIATFE